MDLLEQDSDEENDEDKELDMVDLEPLDGDNEVNRLFSVGRKVFGNYEGSGWHSVGVQYHNTSLKKYLLLFEDGSSDLMYQKRC